MSPGLVLRRTDHKTQSFNLCDLTNGVLRKMTKLGQLGDIAATVGSRGVGSLLQLVLTIFIGRTCSVNDVGFYFAVVSGAYLLAVVLSMGLPWHTMIAVATYLETDLDGHAAAAIRRALKIMLAVCLVVWVSVLSVVGALSWSGQPLAVSQEIFVVVILVGSVLAVQRVSVEAMKGAGLSVTGLLLDRASIPALLLCLLPLRQLFGVQDTRVFLKVCIAAAVLLSAVASAGTILTKVRAPSAQLPRLEWSRLASQFTIQLGDVAVARLPVIVVPILVTLEATGGFGVAFTLTTVVGTIVYALYAYYGPRFVALTARGDMHGLSGMLREAQWVSSLLVLPFFAAFWFAGDAILAVYGPGYRSSFVVLRILAVGLFMAQWFGLSNYYLSICRRERESLIATATALSFFGCVCLALAGAWHLGVIGIAGAYAVACILRNGLSFLLIRSVKLGSSSASTMSMQS